MIKAKENGEDNGALLENSLNSPTQNILNVSMSPQRATRQSQSPMKLQQNNLRLGI